MRVYDFTHRPQSSSSLGFIFRILQGNPKKELLWGLWVEYTMQAKKVELTSIVPAVLGFRFKVQEHKGSARGFVECFNRVN